MATNDAFNHNVPTESDFGYSQAIKSGDLIHVSGQLSLDETGEFRYAGDFAAQLEQTYINLDKVLDHYGVTRNQVVSQTLYVVNLSSSGRRTRRSGGSPLPTGPLPSAWTPTTARAAASWPSASTTRRTPSPA
ncbi:RidA family protein [Stenotrophomonas sp. NPDC087984]